MQAPPAGARVTEIRVARGLSKAELARRAGMLPQTLQRIEDGSTKSLSVTARRQLAPVLGVREDHLLVPVGYPIPPVDDINMTRTRDMQQMILQELQEIRRLLSAFMAHFANPPVDGAEAEVRPRPPRQQQQQPPRRAKPKRDRSAPP
jgi:transcriptional regulator with XRE-family HTH domain